MYMERIRPELPKGFRDFPPEDMIPRQRMLDTIRSVFERFGFVPLETPAVEKEEILTGGDPDFKKEIIRTSIQMGEGDTALRFDLTVPLARFVAEHQNEIRWPFKRYQFGKVWRGEKPQAGRLREFLQCDADIVGSSSVMADAEIVALIYETFAALGIERFLIRINNRKILNAFPACIGFPEDKIGQVLRAVDKLDKQDWKDVKEELLNAGLSEEQAERAKSIVDIDTGDKDGDLEAVSEAMGKGVQEGAEELREMRRRLESLGVPEEFWRFDFSVIRGLGYYTGPVFETVLLDLPEIGSVMSGGRYDGLVDRFSNLSLPATGVSVGVDRLVAALEKLGLFKKDKRTARVMFLNFDPEARDYVQSLASRVRRGGIPAEIYLGSEEMLKGQLSFGLNAGASLILIAGSEEKEKGTVQIKQVEIRKDEEVSEKDLVDKVREIFEKEKGI